MWLRHIRRVASGYTWLMALERERAPSAMPAMTFPSWWSFTHFRTWPADLVFSLEVIDKAIGLNSWLAFVVPMSKTNNLSQLNLCVVSMNRTLSLGSLRMLVMSHLDEIRILKKCLCPSSPCSSSSIVLATMYGVFSSSGTKLWTSTNSLSSSMSSCFHDLPHLTRILRKKHNKLAAK